MSKPSIAWLHYDYHSTPDSVPDEKAYRGIGYYRVVKPAESLQKWFDIEVIGRDFKHWGTQEETFTRLGRDYDLIITRHVLNDRTASNILASAQHYKKKVIVDIDDDLFNVRPDTVAYKDYAKGKPGRGITGALLELADGLIVSTQPLKLAYSKANKHIDVLPNCNDTKDWPLPAERDDGLIHIGFAGGTEHNRDLQMIVQPLAQILEKYPNVVFEVIGALSPERAKELAAMMLKYANHRVLERFQIAGGVFSWEEFPPLLTSQGWDIGLCPLIDDIFNRSKSHIKWMEYSMAGAAVVASPVEPFKVIKHGKTGLLANSTNEWFSCLELLIRNPDIRKQMAKNAYEDIETNWQYKDQAEKWKKVINQYL